MNMRLADIQESLSFLDFAVLQWVRSKEKWEREKAWPNYALTDPPMYVKGTLIPFEPSPLGDRGLDYRRVPVEIPLCIKKSSSKIASSIMVAAGTKRGVINKELLETESQELQIAIEHGTDHMITHAEHPEVFFAWQHVCGAVESFFYYSTGVLSFLKELRPEISDDDFRDSMGVFLDALKTFRQSRVRGIRATLDGPLSEEAFKDLEFLGNHLKLQGII
jgi:hypothetical protein